MSSEHGEGQGCGSPQAPHGLRARVEMEKALIGAICKFPTAYYEAAKIVTAEHFWDNAHRLLFEAVCSLRGRGVTVEPASIYDELTSSGRLQEAGGPSYVAEVYESGFTASGVEYYANRIREQAYLDSLQRILTEHAELARKRQGNPKDLIAAAEAAVFDVAKAASGAGNDDEVSAAAMMNRVYDIIDQRANGGNQGIPTGLTDLDAITTGMHCGELIVIASRPGVGKTAMACNLIRSACHNGHLVLFFSLEMSSDELGERMLVLESGIESQDLRTGALNQADLNRLTKAGDKIRQWPLRINDGAYMRISSIGSAARRQASNGLGLVVVDYLQLIQEESKRTSRQEQVASFSRGLKQLAKSLKVPIVALAQLNRESEQRANQRPKMSDLRESGAIEADADVIILLHRTADQPGRLELLVEKQRNGPRGDVPVKYEPAVYRLSDL